MANINARIDWKPGMEVTAQTFLELDQNIAERQQMANRAANGTQFGIIPFTDFSVKGGFVKNQLEIDRLTCMALLPSGKILQIDEPVSIAIPHVGGDTYFLGCGFGEEDTSFDINHVPYVRKEHSFGIYNLSDLGNSDLFPVMKFTVQDNTFTIDESYIPPCLNLSSDEHFATYISQFSEKMNVLSQHTHLESGEGKRAFLHYAFLLKNYNLRNRTQQFLQQTVEMAMAIDFYVMHPHAESPEEIPVCSEFDPAAWLTWLNNYMQKAAEVLDQVVLENRTIDFDELKRQTKEELYEQLYPELHDALYKELREQLHAEITEEMKLQLTEFITTEFKETLHDQLQNELTDELYDVLYASLYEALYNLLYVPKEKEEEYVPLI